MRAIAALVALLAVGGTGVDGGSREFLTTESAESAELIIRSLLPLLPLWSGDLRYLSLLLFLVLHRSESFL